ncbi:hypothetical protein DAPPUDRAFT_332740 [Daphnia pulex]|uniref:Retroviral polymerase SH3-like domain-containing protein n=1 Tax=Daphnia pulex TaxID=6669 RepID=E9HQU9_DAPPU|nr:hypothetical protein DAPPUDRAFT_332740 [Daphnia pulex]|eukprot:EFX65876.1 hypothetical protein DAPPUDRAFT_332740 [Daphnia pulex]
MRCIFVGVSQTQKAYRFWNLVTRQTVKISRDATSDEHHRLAAVPDEIPTPPFQSVNPSSSIQIHETSPLPSTEHTQNAAEKPANDFMVEDHVPVEPTNQQEDHKYVRP